MQASLSRIAPAAFALALWIAAGTAPAAEDAEPQEAGEKWDGRKRDHHMQGSVNVLFGTGWYLVAPYDKNDPDKACELKPSDSPDAVDGKEGEPVCSGRSGMHLEFSGGFGVLDGLEVIAIFRLGVEQPERGLSMTRLIGPGIKVYSPSDGLFKISFGAAALFDFSERRIEDAYDFVITVPIAAHFDFIPWLGAYIQAAPNISFITQFKLDITGGVGIQGRFP